MSAGAKTSLIWRLLQHLCLCLAAASLALQPQGAWAASRIKDLANVEGVRDNMLVGYGLVVGLNGTGDTLRNSPFTLQSLQGMLERMGVNTRGTNLNTKNVAAVMVTANLGAFSAQGTRLDVTVSALGDATSLRGGTLLVTPIMGADGQVYAVAQGTVATSGFSAQGASASVSQGVTTAGRISNGALVEREINFKLASLDNIKLSLRNPDFTTANRVSSAINAFLGENAASAHDPATIELNKPKNYKGDLVALLTDIEQLRVDPDQVARVVVDEASGIIVMGADVRVSTVAIAQGNLTIRITETPQVSQPEPFSTGGTTTVVPRTNIQIDSQDNRKLAVLNEGVSLQALVDGLNALGIGPRDMISILQTIKAAGALQADIEVM